MKVYLIGDSLINLEAIEHIGCSKESGCLYFYIKGRERCVIANCKNPEQEIINIYNIMFSKENN